MTGKHGHKEAGSTSGPGTEAPLVVIACPDRTHHYLPVTALRDSGIPFRLITGFHHSRNGILARLAERIPGRAGRRIRAMLDTRQVPGVEDDTIIGIPWQDIPFLMLRTLMPSKLLSAKVLPLRIFIYQTLAARHIRRLRPAVVIAFDRRAGIVLRAARSVGAVTVLDTGICHIGEMVRMYRNVVRAHPEYRPHLELAVRPRLVSRVRDEFGHADYVLAGSRFVKRTCMENGIDGGRVHVIDYGVDITRFRPGAGRPSSALRLLAVGDISFWKGCEYLLQAFSHLAGNGIELLLVGRMAGHMEPFARYAHLYRHIPHVPFGEMPGIYSDSDIFVLPTLIEGNNRAVMEAMASGLPVITTEHAGLVDGFIDGVHGMLVPTADAAAVRDAIIRLRDDPSLRRELGGNAALLMRRHTWDDYRSRFTSFISELLAGAPPSDPGQP